jgi:hypothetical protein
MCFFSRAFSIDICCPAPFYFIGYTPGMKTAVSLPDVLFEEAEMFARRLKKSRSQLYGSKSSRTEKQRLE